MDRRHIHFLRSILEGYAGMAVMTTLDAAKGLVVFHVGPGCERELELIIGDLQGDLRIEKFPWETQTGPRGE